MKSSGYIVFVITFAVTLNLPALIAEELVTVEEPQPATISVSPSFVINTNETFKVSITISNVNNLSYWQAAIYFNRKVLYCVNFTEGSFLKSGGPTVWQPGTIDNEVGIASAHGAHITGEAVSGNGTLAYLSFDVRDVGVSSIHLEDVILLNEDDQEIQVELKHGYFYLQSDPEPNAYFYPSPLKPRANETVTFNASGSTPDGGIIQSYEWSFGDSFQGQGMIVNHTYADPGIYNVTLTVIDSHNYSDSFFRRVKVFALLPIDVYTQRGGMELNESSDAFGPREILIASTYLMHSGTPLANSNITLLLYLPNGTQMWARTVETDAQGSAFTVLRMWNMPDFGMYTIEATASIDGENVSDFAEFRLGYLVEILEAIPCNETGVPKDRFEIGEPLYFRLELLNIRSIPLSTTLTITVQDSLSYVIVFYEAECMVAPNQTHMILNLGTVSENAHIGEATGFANALQGIGGQPYCPATPAWFMILWPTPDVSVADIKVSSTEVLTGETVIITVTVLNEYYRPQSFNVTIFANTSDIQHTTVTDLAPYTPSPITYEWNTSKESLGNYEISAFATPVLNETDLSDNLRIDGSVRVLGHDVSIRTITVFPITVIAGELVQINVTALNQGSFAENLEISVYYDSEIIGVQSTFLDPQNSSNLIFNWNTTGLFKGDYVISAEASISADANISDNTRTADKPVTVVYPGHDIAVVAVEPSKTVVGRDYPLFISVVVKNFGTFTENFNVTAYVNATFIDISEITLTSGNGTTVIFMLDTSCVAYGHVSLSGNADPVPGETDTSDNNCTNWTVLVTIPGDVDGDKDVDIFDVVHIGTIYGARKPDPQYNPNYDIEGDGDIDIFDIVIAALNYGKSW